MNERAGGPVVQPVSGLRAGEAEVGLEPNLPSSLPPSPVLEAWQGGMNCGEDVNPMLGQWEKPYSKAWFHCPSQKYTRRTTGGDV